MPTNDDRKKSTTITVRLDPDLRKDAEFVFESMGTSLSEAVRIFLRHSVMENGFPFPVTVVSDVINVKQMTDSDPE